MDILLISQTFVLVSMVWLRIPIVVLIPDSKSNSILLQKQHLLSNDEAIKCWDICIIGKLEVTKIKLVASATILDCL